MLGAVESAWLFLCGPSPLKQATGGIRFPGGWGARVVYRFETMLSTETSLLPWHMTPSLPGHVARAFLRVILRAGGVSHDLKHIAFLSTNIKASIFLCLGLPRKPSDITSPLAPWWCHIVSDELGRNNYGCLKCKCVTETGVNVNSWVHGVNGKAGLGGVVLMVAPCVFGHAWLKIKIIIIIIIIIRAEGI